MVTPKWQPRLRFSRGVNGKATMVADEGRLSFVSSSRSGAPDLLVAIWVDPNKVVARNHCHVLEANGALLRCNRVVIQLSGSSESVCLLRVRSDHTNATIYAISCICTPQHYADESLLNRPIIRPF